MTLVAKSTKKKDGISDQKGQISIFFSASLVVLISIIAFVINVGLFVKAKINLQNATDAAAYAGAAVQARQLSKIAHLNWEMRNIYKEWLFKYYVLGNLNIEDVESPSGTGTMSFQMQTDVNVLTDERREDLYNFPSVCIHIGGSNLCKRYAVPGLPEFGSSNLPGADQASRAFQDALIASKSGSCIDSTRVNMMTATMWAYNVLAVSESVFATEGAQVMANKQGAWPQAIELAMRIRNLERIVNREARSGSVCLSPGAGSKINCQTSISDVTSEPFMGNERLVKAFYSGFRNIGGSAEDDEMKSTFALTELPPSSFREPDVGNASNLLIPTTYDKQYLDLKLMTVNYAFFYSALIPRAQGDTSGACDVSKVAIPVPGYPLGYYKNPEFLTYYAVKGEAEFFGMFNPFGTEPVVLTAFAAAKPMGGRIGPMLFKHRPTDSATVGRQDSSKRRSVPYISTFKMTGAEILLPNFSSRRYELREAQAGDYGPGVPLPVNGGSPETNFWLDGADMPVGGRIQDASGVQFGLPNLVYDFDAPFSDEGYSPDASTQLSVIDLADPSSNQAIGLYSKSQFAKFRGTAIGSGQVSLQTLEDEVARVRAPTLYEAANYLVPIPFDEFANTNLGHFGQIPGTAQQLPNGVKVYRNHIYAPLYGEEPSEILYKNTDQVLSTISEFMIEQQTGIKKYKDAMNKAAKAIYDQKSLVSDAASGSAGGYEAAAASVSDINFDSGDITSEVPDTCKSLAGTFLEFYYGGGVAGPLRPTNPGDSSCSGLITLYDLLREYYSGSSASGTFRKDHYFMEFSWNSSNFGASPVPGSKGMLTAYVPGAFTGVSFDGIFDNLSSASSPELMRRNFYSTKLVALSSLKENGIYKENIFPVMSEGDAQTNLDDIKQRNFKNPLQLPPEAEQIKH